MPSRGRLPGAACSAGGNSLSAAAKKQEERPMGIIEGTVWKFGDNIDTDVIIPATYLVTTDKAELGKHCMEGVDPAFSQKVRGGDIIVAGKNFGCGSSREFRNAFNMGLAIFEATGISEGIGAGDRISVDQDTGEITDHTNGRRFAAYPIPPFMQELIEAGGLVSYVLKQKQG
jgi:3-isopropylmalate dehydratase small subunit